MLAASYRDDGICLSEDRKISIEEPNCQTASKIKVQIAVFLSPCGTGVLHTKDSQYFIDDAIDGEHTLPQDGDCHRTADDGGQVVRGAVERRSDGCY